MAEDWLETQHLVLIVQSIKTGVIGGTTSAPISCISLLGVKITHLISCQSNSLLFSQSEDICDKPGQRSMMYIRKHAGCLNMDMNEQKGDKTTGYDMRERARSRTLKTQTYTYTYTCVCTDSTWMCRALCPNYKHTHE